MTLSLLAPLLLAQTVWSTASDRVRIDAFGRDFRTPVQFYDLYGGAVSSPFFLQLGPQDVPDNKQLDGFRLEGSLTGTPGVGSWRYLHGLTFDLHNLASTGDASFDPTRVRAIIGTVYTHGPGSVRFLHGHAYAMPGSTGAISAANLQVSPAGTTNYATALQLTSSGAPGIADGINFSSLTGTNYRRGIDLSNSQYSDAAFRLGYGIQGGIHWVGGAGLYSPGAGDLVASGRVVHAEPLVVATTHRTLYPMDSFVVANATNGPITLTLPPAAGMQGRTYTIKAVANAPHDVTIVCAGPDSIDGASSLTINGWVSVRLTSDGGALWLRN